VGLVVAGLVLAASGPDRAAYGDDSSGSDTTEPVVVELSLFFGASCPYCASERRFLEELQTTRPLLVVHEYEVWNNEANRERFDEMAESAGVEARAVPTTFLGGRVWVGFDDVVADEIEEAVDAALAGHPLPPRERTTIDVPLFGRVDVGDRSLLLSTVLIGFVDGINPCSLWVLSILLAVVLHSGSRRRVLAVGTVFLVVTSAMYGLYIAGSYSVLSYVDFLPWIRRGVAVVAGVLGLWQLKDVVAFHRGPTLGVPEAAKPEMYQRMRRLASPDRPLPVVLGATTVLAVGVSLLETPCTLGLPILWTNLLSQRDVPAAGAVVLFLVYLCAFLIDELVVFAVVVATMRAVKLQERHGRELKLVSGVVMVALAVVMFARPTLMETLGGALAVFGIAALVASAGLFADRMLRSV
jgi:cytochrome c biogenesis protein CcdA/glutaredoxin